MSGRRRAYYYSDRRVLSNRNQYVLNIENRYNGIFKAILSTNDNVNVCYITVKRSDNSVILYNDIPVNLTLVGTFYEGEIQLSIPYNQSNQGNWLCIAKFGSITAPRSIRTSNIRLVYSHIPYIGDYVVSNQITNYPIELHGCTSGDVVNVIIEDETGGIVYNNTFTITSSCTIIIPTFGISLELTISTIINGYLNNSVLMLCNALCVYHVSFEDKNNGYYELQANTNNININQLKVVLHHPDNNITYTRFYSFTGSIIKSVDVTDFIDYILTHAGLWNITIYFMNGINEIYLNNKNLRLVYVDIPNICSYVNNHLIQNYSLQFYGHTTTTNVSISILDTELNPLYNYSGTIAPSGVFSVPDLDSPLSYSYNIKVKVNSNELLDITYNCTSLFIYNVSFNHGYNANFYVEVETDNQAVSCLLTIKRPDNSMQYQYNITLDNNLLRSGNFTGSIPYQQSNAGLWDVIIQFIEGSIVRYEYTTDMNFVFVDIPNICSYVNGAWISSYPIQHYGHISGDTTRIIISDFTIPQVFYDNTNTIPVSGLIILPLLPLADNYRVTVYVNGILNRQIDFACYFNIIQYDNEHENQRITLYNSGTGPNIVATYYLYKNTTLITSDLLSGASQNISYSTLSSYITKDKTFRIVYSLYYTGFSYTYTKEITTSISIYYISYFNYAGGILNLTIISNDDNDVSEGWYLPDNTNILNRTITANDVGTRYEYYITNLLLPYSDFINQTDLILRIRPVIFSQHISYVLLLVASGFSDTNWDIRYKACGDFVFELSGVPSGVQNVSIYVYPNVIHSYIYTNTYYPSYLTSYNFYISTITLQNYSIVKCNVILSMNFYSLVYQKIGNEKSILLNRMFIYVGSQSNVSQTGWSGVYPTHNISTNYTAGIRLHTTQERTFDYLYVLNHTINETIFSGSVLFNSTQNQFEVYKNLTHTVRPSVFYNRNVRVSNNSCSYNRDIIDTQVSITLSEVISTTAYVLNGRAGKYYITHAYFRRFYNTNVLPDQYFLEVGYVTLTSPLAWSNLMAVLVTINANEYLLNIKLWRNLNECIVFYNDNLDVVVCIDNLESYLYYQESYTTNINCRILVNVGSFSNTTSSTFYNNFLATYSFLSKTIRLIFDDNSFISLSASSLKVSSSSSSSVTPFLPTNYYQDYRHYSRCYMPGTLTPANTDFVFHNLRLRWSRITQRRLYFYLFDESSVRVGYYSAGQWNNVFEGIFNSNNRGIALTGIANPNPRNILGGSSLAINFAAPNPDICPYVFMFGAVAGNTTHRTNIKNHIVGYLNTNNANVYRSFTYNLSSINNIITTNVL